MKGTTLTLIILLALLFASAQLGVSPALATIPNEGGTPAQSSLNTTYFVISDPGGGNQPPMTYTDSETYITTDPCMLQICLQDVGVNPDPEPPSWADDIANIYVDGVAIGTYDSVNNRLPYPGPGPVQCFTSGVVMPGTHTITVEMVYSWVAGSMFATEIIVIPAAEVIITISATEPVIPTGSKVKDGRVLYKSELTITAKSTATGDPVAVLSIQVQSDRAQDTLIQPTEPTNDKGVTKARIQTREKGSATITATTSDISAAPVPTIIEFNNANYERRFRVTVYIIADENDFSGPAVTDPCGLTGTYYRTFLYSRTGVLMQGAGRTRDGAYIQIDWMAGGPRGANTCFRVVPFPTTASGEPLQEGVTIAVDPDIIPLGSEVYIEGVGTRTAQDTGGGIQGYHIDLYVGAGQAASAGWANPRLSVRYLDP